MRRTFTEGASFLAAGEGNRLIVLKRVDEDCMLGKALHPSIVDRLGRVREVAHAGVANLIAVEKDRQGDKDEAWLVWEYVEGETILEWARRGRSSRELLVMARELMLSVDQLHMQGLVHGALVEGNVIVTPEGVLKLTHVSPLLYTDMGVDVESVVGLLKDVAGTAGEKGEPLLRAVEGAGEPRVAGSEGELRRMAARVASVLGGGVRGDAGTRGNGDAGKGKRWVVMQVGMVILVGVVIAYGVWRAFAG